MITRYDYSYLAAVPMPYGRLYTNTTVEILLKKDIYFVDVAAHD
jgi:hypothetical protein